MYHNNHKIMKKSIMSQSSKIYVKIIKTCYDNSKLIVTNVFIVKNIYLWKHIPKTILGCDLLMCRIDQTASMYESDFLVCFFSICQSIDEPGPSSTKITNISICTNPSHECPRVPC